MDSVIIFILGIAVGVIGYVKLLKPNPASSPPPLPPESPITEPSGSINKTKREGKRKKVSVLTPKEKYRAITRAKLPSKHVLNGEEKIIFKAVTEFISRWNRNEDNPPNACGLVALAQVSIGEFIGPKSSGDDATRDERDAWFALQARRADFLIVDSDFMPVLVIEHQGSGHFQGDWKQRDKDKMTAYNYAQIPVVQTYAGVEDNRVSHVEQPHKIGGLIASKLNERYSVVVSSKG